MAYGIQLEKFFSIWDQRRRPIEINVYFNDVECLWLFRKIEILYEKSKNKVEAMSSSPIISNDRLLGGILDLEEEISDLRDKLSRRLRLHLTFKYIFFPTFAKWLHVTKEWLMKSANEVENKEDE
ncbi:MAG: hypothetical protein C0613_05720 [Desulfobulbaceae bacterium]|nr:MAG: hypothetical protein C0613_05720 [Desulfobulbaceae bacterium]